MWRGFCASAPSQGTWGNGGWVSESLSNSSKVVVNAVISQGKGRKKRKEKETASEGRDRPRPQRNQHHQLHGAGPGQLISPPQSLLLGQAPAHSRGPINVC